MYRKKKQLFPNYGLKNLGMSYLRLLVSRTSSFLKIQIQITSSVYIPKALKKDKNGGDKIFNKGGTVKSL